LSKSPWVKKETRGGEMSSLGAFKQTHIRSLFYPFLISYALYFLAVLLIIALTPTAAIQV
jgi:hypothetical protein